LLIFVALAGAGERPRISLMTALPLVWGEGETADILQGRSGRSETLKRLDPRFDIRPIDVISAKTLGRDIAVIAQPRRLSPLELVAFDKWVRRGGRAMIFADPELLGSSSYPLGDNRRAPPVTLLDPLFKHWGIDLGDSDRVIRTATYGGVKVAFAGAASWTFGNNCTVLVPEAIDCRIGKGRVILVGDADMLDARLWQEQGADNPAWIANQLDRLIRR
jgi:ABC-type uncharacterized transport system involved in gliding motility auxiliary subunit